MLALGVPKKKPGLPEAELHALIPREAKYRLGCQDFAPEFTLHQTPDNHPSGGRTGACGA